jgi:hypothetical protein
MVRFEEGRDTGRWSQLKEIRSNQPVQDGDYWFFQAKWDPNTECHTVLGVGNRKGIHAMLAGVCISIAGMIYAFYVKPTIRRRRNGGLAMAENGETAAAGDALPAGPGGNGDADCLPALTGGDGTGRKTKQGGQTRR